MCSSKHIAPLLVIAACFHFAHCESHCQPHDNLDRIDVHSHFVPPFWRNESMTAGYSKPDGMPGIPAWSEADHLKLMAQANITKSILSITSPGTYLVPGDDHQARILSRECNEFAADLKRRRPDRFGFWAALPLPDVEGSLLELAYALDHLNADGVAVFTNSRGTYLGDESLEPVFQELNRLNADGVAVFTNSRGTYLGDESLEPVFQELNRRNATVFVHPTSPCMPDGQGPAAPLTRYPNPMFEFFFESARAVINLFLSETIANFTDITYIISHAGGALPPTIERFTGFASSILGLPFEINSDVVKEAFARQFYFDLAGFAFPDQVYGLLRYVDASRIIYGSDYPYTPASGVLSIADTMNENIGEAFPRRQDRQAIFTGNAQRILARAG